MVTPNLSALPRHCKHQPWAGLSSTARSTYLALTVLELTHSDSCSFDADMAFLIQSRRDNSHPRWSLITPTYFSLDKVYLPYQSTLLRPIAQLSNELITPYWPSLPRHQASVYLWSHHNIHLQLSLLWVSDSCLCAWAPPSCSAKLPDVTLLSSMLATPLPHQTQRKEDKSHWLLLCYCSCLQGTLVLPLFSSAFFFFSYICSPAVLSRKLSGGREHGFVPWLHSTGLTGAWLRIPSPTLTQTMIQSVNQSKSPGSVCKHTWVLAHPLATDIQKSYRRFPINLFCPYFRHLQRPWTSVPPSLKVSCAQGCRWHASKRINYIKFFFQLGE